jgi:flavin reductase (DIM6/NTAB) family NADH-FMN oxidoreductase RutF
MYALQNQMDSKATNTKHKIMHERRLRDALGQFVTGVTVVATKDHHDRFVGLTVSSFTSVSLDPPLVLWNLRKSSHIYDVFRTSEYFVISVLAADQIEIAKQFSASIPDRFAGINWRRSPAAKLPIIDDAAAWFECRNSTHYDGGDHSIFIGEVSEFECSGSSPLLYHAGSYVITTDCATY